MNSVCTLCCDGCKEHGERIERDRIIELLEEHVALQVSDDTDQDSLDYHEDTCCLCKNLHGLGVAIALIKGEK